MESETFRDRLATVDEHGKRVWVYPQQPKGKRYNWRTALSILYLLVFFGLPFVKVNGNPVFLLNVVQRRFILFGQIFWPQDFFIFAIGMLVFIVFIILFTVVFGRVFCGWVCPQTIFMEMVFRKLEYWIEGSAAQQKLLDKAPWTAKKVLKKATKWVLFYLVSFAIANGFLAYIIGVSELWNIVTEPVSQHIGGLIAIFIFASVFNFIYLWFREQVCLAICPYGRLQGVLMDKHSIVVAYDYVRGESRAKLKKNEERAAGDCIDCHQCVSVCPTGIDIRNGTQMECVNCTACIDACNHVMEAVGFEPHLIRLASEEGLKTRKYGGFNLRMKAYTAVMLLLLGLEAFLLGTRSDVAVNILRTPGQLFQEQPGGRFSNLYNYKLLNKTYEDKLVTFRPENFTGTIEIVGQEALHIPRGSDAKGSLFVFISKDNVRHRKTDLKIGMYENGRRIAVTNITFLGPFRVD